VALWITLIILAFLCGSIPFGLLIARCKGVDIRQHGSGNIGATNVGRVLGRGLGWCCFGLDLLKGFIPAFAAGALNDLIPRSLLPPPIESRSAWLWLAVMAAPVLGHIFSPWLRFKGGKGVAAGLGAVLGVFPYLTIPALGALLTWAAVLFVSRYMSLASCAAAVALPLLVASWGVLTARVSGLAGATLPAGFWPFVIATAILGALVVLRHRANIQRLLAGTESRIPRRAPAAR
jgi:acyl phosphate:glycerol-3-phosphate acyltransferase